jgi:hypothetical protein
MFKNIRIPIGSPKKPKKKLGESKDEVLSPVTGKEYLITDQCFWEQEVPEDYNPTDPNRTPHAITLVDKDTGTIVILPSGSTVKIVSVRKKDGTRRS